MYQHDRQQGRHATSPLPSSAPRTLRNTRDAAANDDSPPAARHHRRHRFVPGPRLATLVALAALVAPTSALAWPFTSSATLTAAPTPAPTPSPTPSPPVGSPYVTPSSAAPIVDTPALVPPAPAPASGTQATPPPGTHAAPPTPTTPVSPAAAALPTAPVPATSAPAATPPGTHAAPATPDVPVGPAAAAPTAAGEEAAGKAGDVPLALGFHGAMEFYYAYNTNKPSNDITNWRWYDHRHNQLGLQGLWFAPEYLIGPISGHFQLQLGVLAELFWYSERSLEEDMLWRLLQEATMSWQTPWKRLSIEGGIFNVPFGPEWNLASKNWNWSTSNLFALMPYQITGARANFDLGRGLVARVGIYNGWDRIVKDNNKQKAMMASLEWTDENDEETYVFFNYMMGNERDPDDERGRTPRHTFDLYAQWHVRKPLFIRAWTFSGFEHRPGATDGWLGLAGFLRVDPLWWFSITGRGDYVYVRSKTENLFHTDVLADPNTTTALGSGTLTLDFHPHTNISLRLEGRYDSASFPLFYKGAVPLSDPNDPRSFIPNANRQATILAGMTTWF
jgi:hypothetical protein